MIDSWIKQYEGDPDFEFDLLAIDIGERLVERMERLSINRTELAAKIGVSKARISQILSGHDNLTLKSLVAVAIETREPHRSSSEEQRNRYGSDSFQVASFCDSGKFQYRPRAIDPRETLLDRCRANLLYASPNEGLLTSGISGWNRLSTKRQTKRLKSLMNLRRKSRARSSRNLLLRRIPT